MSEKKAKYMIHATIKADGTIQRKDVVGAIFGQTEGLLGEELQLRKLQRTGRIGHVDVDLKSNKGKVSGEILLPSSLDPRVPIRIVQTSSTHEVLFNVKIIREKVDDVPITAVSNCASWIRWTFRKVVVHAKCEFSMNVCSPLYDF